MHRKLTRSVALLGAGALAAAALAATSMGAGPSVSAAPDDVTIEWWHIQNNDPGLSLWQDVADEFMEANPHVTIDIVVYENEAFKTAIAPRLQAGDPPDLFQSWGGGGMLEQYDAGLLQDITDAAAPWIDDLNAGAVSMYQVDGRQYGIPFDLGMVGFWYNTELFAEAGIDAPPATWAELLEDVQALNDAGITPIALAGGDKWPAMFWWGYLALRLGGAEGMNQTFIDRDFSTDPWVQAGEHLEELNALDPFQPGFLAAGWDGAGGQAATFAAGNAAMHLMGQWAPGTHQANTPDGEPSVNDVLGWFPFPAVEGGAGDPADAFGGGNGFAVGRDAPPEAVEFLQYATSLDVANRWGALNSGILPVTVGSEASTTDPYLTMVLEGRANAQFVQLYLDQAFDPALGGVINDEVQSLLAGQSSSQDVADAVTAAAGG